MSQTQPNTLTTDRVHTLPIDATGEIARFAVSGSHNLARAATIELQIDGDAPASYTLEFGSIDALDGEDVIHWFPVPDDYSYDATDYVEDAWIQSRRYIRIRVTSAAPAGSEARVLVAYGRQ